MRQERGPQWSEQHTGIIMMLLHLKPDCLPETVRRTPLLAHSNSHGLVQALAMCGPAGVDVRRHGGDLQFSKHICRRLFVISGRSLFRRGPHPLRLVYLTANLTPTQVQPESQLSILAEILLRLYKPMLADAPPMQPVSEPRTYDTCSSIRQ
ncbi:hypothetical protein Bbelb_013100 [Branchiostoma belcheri]|nr:hypothetical protein Bbelb_013100 [Branchiostoma belcheri]